MNINYKTDNLIEFEWNFKRMITPTSILYSPSFTAFDCSWKIETHFYKLPNKKYRNNENTLGIHLCLDKISDLLDEQTIKFIIIVYDNIKSNDIIYTFKNNHSKIRAGIEEFTNIVTTDVNITIMMMEYGHKYTQNINIWRPFTTLLNDFYNCNLVTILQNIIYYTNSMFPENDNLNSENNKIIEMTNLLKVIDDYEQTKQKILTLGENILPIIKDKQIEFILEYKYIKRAIKQLSIIPLTPELTNNNTDNISIAINNHNTKISNLCHDFYDRGWHLSHWLHMISLEQKKISNIINYIKSTQETDINQMIYTYSDIILSYYEQQYTVLIQHLENDQKRLPELKKLNMDKLYHNIIHNYKHRIVEIEKEAISVINVCKKHNINYNKMDFIDMINTNNENDDTNRYALLEYDQLICPITKEQFVDPVLLADGHLYEKEAITKWLKEHDRSPMTNQKLANKEIRKVHIIDKLVKEIHD